MCRSIMEVGDGLTTLSTCSHLHWVLERSVSKLNVCFCVSFFFHFGCFGSLLQCVGLSSCGAWAPECVGSVVTARGLNVSMACGILVLQPGIESSGLEEGRFLTTGPPEKSLN